MKNSLMIKFAKTSPDIETDYYFKTVVRRAVKETLIHERFPYDAELSVTLCDNEYIKKLNKQYRNKDSATDVLSFPIYDNGDFDVSECISGAVLGDIVISLKKPWPSSSACSLALSSEITISPSTAPDIHSETSKSPLS